MTIDPATLPNGTVTEFRCDTPGCDVSHYSDAPRELFHGVQVVRTFSPDPLPSQEVPRDEWANIKPGSRVRLVEHNGDEHTVTTVENSLGDGRMCSAEWTFGAEIARVFVLDEPADPDADLARAIEDAVPDGSWDGKTTLANLRAAGFDVVKAGA